MEILGDRLNNQPPILFGSTSQELMILVVVSAVVWVPVVVTVSYIILGSVSMGFGVAFAFIAGSVFLLSKLLQRVKRGRPDGYYQHKIATYLEDKGIYKSRFIRETQVWDVGRTK